jgi:hypothetical protein
LHLTLFLEDLGGCQGREDFGGLAVNLSEHWLFLFERGLWKHFHIALYHNIYKSQAFIKNCLLVKSITKKLFRKGTF